MKTVHPDYSHDPIPPAIADAAAAWLARRDRGLTPTEQDAYLQWLAADPRHAEALTQHAAALERMMQLYEWQPAHDTEPNPGLFASVPAMPKRQSWLWSAGLAAAAAVAVFVWQDGRRTTGAAPQSPVPTATPKSRLHVNERMALPDGSRVELKDGSRVIVQYSGMERRVQLAGGEAQFSVWKDAARPFIVEVAGVEVRAVGTAFNVRLGERAVEVLVTEGRVKLASEADPAGGVPATAVSAGERAIVPIDGEAPVPVVTPVTPEEISRELAWQAPRLQFQETPLSEAIAEFNQLNRHQLVLGDPELGRLRIGGTFRPDNVEGFIRLLDTTLDIRAEPAGENRTVLRRAR